MFIGQSKIYTYMSPNKCSGIRSPLQEENSVAHHEVRCQGKPLAGIYRKREGKPLKWPCFDHSRSGCRSCLLHNYAYILNFYAAFSHRVRKEPCSVLQLRNADMGERVACPRAVPCWSNRFSCFHSSWHVLQA